MVIRRTSRPFSVSALGVVDMTLDVDPEMQREGRCDGSEVQIDSQGPLICGRLVAGVACIVKQSGIKRTVRCRRAAQQMLLCGSSGPMDELRWVTEPETKFGRQTASEVCVHCIPVVVDSASAALLHPAARNAIINMPSV